MKKFLIILLSLALVLGVCTACGSMNCTITVEGGTIIVDGVDKGSTAKVKKGKEITVQFTDQNGIEFTEWTDEEGETISEEEDYTFKVGGNLTLTANYNTVDMMFEDVVFPTSVKVGYTGANAIPEVTYKKTYTKADGTSVTPLVNVTYVVDNDETKSEAVDLGTYSVEVTISADGFISESKTMSLEIVAGTLPTIAANRTVDYDPTATKVEIDVKNRLAGDSVSIIYRKDNQVVENPKDAGVYEAEITATCENYEEKKFYATLTINKAQGIITPGTDSLYFESNELKNAGLTTIDTATLNNSEQTITFKIVKAGQEVQKIQEVGDYVVYLNAAETSNYHAAVQKQIVVTVVESQAVSSDVDADLANIQFVNKTVDYNGEVQTISFIGTYPTDKYTVAYKDTEKKDAGKYKARVRFTNKETGDKKDFDADFIINKVALTITAPDFTHIQGDSLPNLNSLISTSGLKGADSLASLDGKVALTYNFTRTSAANTSFLEEIKEWRKDTTETLGTLVDGNYVYPISITGLTSKNYNITFVDGKATVVMSDFEHAATISSKLTPKAGATDTRKGLQYNANVTSKVTLFGEEFYGMGVNYFSIMDYAVPGANFDPSRACEHLEILASYNVRAIRVSIMPFYARDYGSFYNYYGQYIEYLDAVVAKAEEVGIGLIPSLFWTTAPQDLFDEGTATGLRDENSKTFKFIKDYTTFIVNRYAESPAIFIWEFTNEFNLAADNGQAPDELPAGSSRKGRTWTEDKITTELCNTFYTKWVKIIRDADPYDRLIGNGDANYRPAQYNLWQESVKNHSDTNWAANWTPDTKEQQTLVGARFNPVGMNAISWHVYAGGLSSKNYSQITTDSVHGKTMVDHMQSMMDMAASISNTQNDGKVCYWGEAGPGSGGGITGHMVVGDGKAVTFEDVKKMIDAYGDAMMQTHFPLVLIWTYDPDGTLPENRVDEHSSGAEWSWCIEENNDKGYFTLVSIKETNDAIDQGLSTATRVESPARA